MRRLSIAILSLFLITGCEERRVTTITPAIQDPWELVYCGREKDPSDSLEIYRRTMRMKVPNGWLYLTTSARANNDTGRRETMAFVPDIFPEPEKR